MSAKSDRATSEEVAPLDDAEYTEEEVEITDDEGERGAGEGEEPTASGAGATNMSTPVVVPSDPKAKATGTRTPRKSNGVEASERVKKLIEESPGASSSRDGGPGQAKQTKVSLFTTGLWNERNFSEVKIIFPVLGVGNETTNELTRSTRPESRFWKDEIKFSLGGEVSRTLRIFNVPIPFSENPRYGSPDGGFVYLCLPGFLQDRFAKAGKARRPTVVIENSLQPDGNRWWKIANNVSDKFGVGDPGTKSFEPKNIQTYFAGAQRGLIANVELQFYCKASTTDLSKITATTPQKIAVELVRAYIMEVDQDIELPVRIARGKKPLKAGATRSDLASDEVMKRLSALGL